MMMSVEEKDVLSGRKTRTRKESAKSLLQHRTKIVTARGLVTVTRPDRQRKLLKAPESLFQRFRMYFSNCCISTACPYKVRLDGEGQQFL